MQTKYPLVGCSQVSIVTQYYILRVLDSNMKERERGFFPRWYMYLGNLITKDTRDPINTRYARFARGGK